MEKEEKLEEVKEKISGVVENIGGKFNELTEKIGNVLDRDNKNRKQKAIVTSRVLFISVLDKLYLIGFIVAFAIATFAVFVGDLTSSYYGFWNRVGVYLLVLILFALAYLFFNWLYRCVAKTMLCLTKNEVYKEEYVPFKRGEISIPLEKITRVSTLDVFWIFRLLIIHQYHQLPLFFWTWNNHEFKDALNELITGDREKIENEFEDKNIIPKGLVKYIKWFFLGLFVLVTIIGISRGIAYLFSPARSVPGTYKYEDKQVMLYNDGTCSMSNVVSKNVTSCEWVFNNDLNHVYVTYEYRYDSGWYGSYDRSDEMRFSYDHKNKTLSDDERIFVKTN